MKKLIIIGFCLLTLSALQAQKSEQYLHFNLGGGLNNLSYSLQNGTGKAQLGYTVNAAYSYFFNSNWGLQTGAGVKLYGAKSTLNLLTTENRVDTDNDPFELRKNYNNWQEKQNALYLEIPLMAQYKRSFNEKYGMLASVGAKIGLPLSASYKNAGGEITTTGYYSQWDVELSDLPQHGLLTTTGEYKGDYSLKTAYMAVANLGGLYKLSPKTDLYVGLYLNYGLNNILNPQSKLIYQFDGVYNGVLSSNQTNSVKPIAVGIKVGLYLQVGQQKQTFLPAEVIPQTVPQFDSIVAPGYVSKQQQPDSTNSAVEVPQNKALIAEKQNIVLIAKAIDAKTNAPVNAKLTVIDANEQIKTIVADENGLFNVELPEGKIYKVEIEAPDYVSQSQTIDLTNVAGGSKNEITLTPMVKVEKEVSLKFSILNFQIGVDKITPEQTEVLNSISQTLIENPEIIIEVSGHTDNIGKYQENIVLSKKRANKVVNYLISKGVNKSQLVAKGYGKTRPIADNRTKQGRFENRRVEFKIIK